MPDIILPTHLTPEDTLKMLKEIPDVKIYGFLLTRDGKHPASKMISERFYELHNLSGPNFLLLAFNPPYEFEDSYKAYLERTLGTQNFESIWQVWNKGILLGDSANYCDLFNPRIQFSQLPCLVLFTNLNDLKEQEVVVRLIPDWDTDSLYDFLSFIMESVRNCCEQPEEERVECLKKSLTSPQAQILAHYKHIRDKTLDYMKKNPSYIVLAPTGLLLAFANAQMLPLGAGAIVFFEYIQKLLDKNE